jgi:ankyrin repeat protein
VKLFSSFPSCSFGGKLLLFLLRKGECDVVECLLSSGADFNLCNVDEYPPLISALSSGHYDIVLPVLL